jgi:hypothetical protein
MVAWTYYPDVRCHIGRVGEGRLVQLEVTDRDLGRCYAQVFVGGEVRTVYDACDDVEEAKQIAVEMARDVLQKTLKELD